MTGRISTLLMAAILATSLPLAAQARRRRRPASAPAKLSPVTIEVERLLQTAAADQRDHAYSSAERAFTAALQLDPGNATARSGLARAQDGACHAAAAAAITAAQWTQAAALLQHCAAPVSGQDAGTLARVRQLAAIQTALAQGAWTAAAAAMRQLAAPNQGADTTSQAALPPGALVPAYAAFGAGHPRAAAALAARLHPAGATPVADLGRFDAFLRNRARRRAWRAAAWPLLAAYLLALLAGLYWGLRGLIARPEPMSNPAPGPTPGPVAAPETTA